MHKDTFKRQIDLQAIMASDKSKGAPSKIEILQCGAWDTPYHGMFMIKPSDLQEYIDNFQSGLRAGDSLPIDYEHYTDGGAAGWITDLSLEDSSDDSGLKSLWASVEWTPDGRKALEDKVYKFFSPEFAPSYYVDPENIESESQNVLMGGAITTRPLFKKLKSVMASATAGGKTTSGLTASSAPNTIYVKDGEKTLLTLDEIRKKDASTITADDKSVLQKNIAELSKAEVSYFGLGDEPVKASDKPAATVTPAPVAPVQANDGQVVVSKEVLDALQASAKRGEAAADALEKNTISASVKEHIARGAVKSDQLDQIVEALQASSPSVRAKYEEIFKNLPDNSIVAAGEKGKKGDGPKTQTLSASDQLDAKAQEIVDKSEGKVSYGTALRQASEENPALAKAATELDGLDDNDADDNDGDNT